MTATFPNGPFRHGFPTPRAPCRRSISSGRPGALTRTIRVTRVTPKKTGKKIVTVAFLNVLYAEGVQNSTLDMRILKHEADYLIAELLNDESGQAGRTAVISHIEFEWIRRMCPGIWSERPPESMGSAAHGSVSIYLDEIFGA